MANILLFLVSFLVFLLAVGLMAIGVMARRSPIAGSCGGLGNIPGVESDCGGSCRQTCPRRRGEK